MKRLAERPTRLRDGSIIGPNRGYLAPCKQCGLIVVHAESTGRPFHMHRWSKLCSELAAAKART